MEFGCRAHDLTRAHTPDELGAACEEQGVRYVQLALAKSFPQMVSGAGEISPGMGAHVRRALAAHDVEVAVMGCYFNMIDADLAAREQGIRKFEAYLSCARSFGCGIVASETGSVDPKFRYTEENFTDEAFREAADVIGRLVAHAERVGAVVGIEPGVNHPIHDVETCARLVESVGGSPALGFILDPTALITPALADSQLDITCSMLKAFPERIVATHLVDYRIEGGELVRCNLGEGQMDVASVLGAVLSAKPHGHVLTEFTEDEAIGRFVASWQ